MWIELVLINVFTHFLFQGFILGAWVGARHSIAGGSGFAAGAFEQFRHDFRVTSLFPFPLLFRQFHDEDDAGRIGPVRRVPDDSLDMGYPNWVLTYLMTPVVVDLRKHL